MQPNERNNVLPPWNGGHQFFSSKQSNISENIWAQMKRLSIIQTYSTITITGGCRTQRKSCWSLRCNPLSPSPSVNNEHKNTYINCGRNISLVEDSCYVLLTLQALSDLNLTETTADLFCRFLSTLQQVINSLPCSHGLRCQNITFFSRYIIKPKAEKMCR